jgi:hypothetical protein
MILDIHAHAYRRPAPFVTRFPTVEEVLRRYDEVGIDMGVLLPVVNPEIYLPQANEDILDMAARYPDRIIPWCNIDPRALTHSADAPLGRLLRYYRDLGCKGLGEVMLNVPLLDSQVQNLFRHAQDVGLPVTFDGSDRVGGDFGLLDEPGLPQLERTLQWYPNLTILGHGPVFWIEIERLAPGVVRKPAFRPDGEQEAWQPPDGPIREEGAVARLLRAYPNLRGELSDAHSALARDPAYGGRFLTEFQDRLYFGTDYCCVGMPFHTLDLLRAWRAEGRISPSVFDKVTGENARILMGLAPARAG